MGWLSHVLVSSPDGAPPSSVATAASLGAGFVRGRFARFAAVGLSGVVVNAGLLLLFVEGLGWPVLVASVLSIEVSTLSNWALNRRFTWADRDAGAWRSLAKYHGVAAVGMLLQWLVLAASLAYLPVHYLVGTLLGIGAATAWNFAGNHFLSFRARDAAPLPRWALYATSAFVQLVVAAVFAHPWDTFVFQRSVEDLLLRGLTPYEVAAAAPSYTYWGGGLPALPMWYAYPPVPLALMAATYFPSALGWLPWGWTGRLLIRLPFIAATLGLAALARKAIATAPGATPVTLAKAARAERLLLLNPLLIVIAALWGQFEALILVLLLAMVLALRQATFGRAGLWYALAVCVKIFPLYLAPLLAVHVWRTGGRKGVTRFALAAGALGAAVNLPFLLLSPGGYMQQVFLMHGARSPARLAPLAYVDNLLEILSETWPALPAPAVWSRWLGVVSLVLVTAVLLAVAATSRRRPATEGRLLEWMALSFLGGLLATKVLNEQYLVLPLGLLLIARAHPQRTMPGGVGRFVAVGSWAVVAAGLVGGLNLLFALPAPIAKAVLGSLAPEAIGRLAAAVGLSAAQLKSLLAWATGLFLLGPALVAIARLRAPVTEGLLSIERRLLAAWRGNRTGPRPVALLGAILLLCTAPLGVALAGGIGAQDNARPLATGSKWVLAEVTTSWYNPSNDGERALGTWDGVADQPEAGFYNLNAHKAITDVARMRAAGFDGLIIDVHPYYAGPAGTLRRVAEAEGMPYALGVTVGAPRTGPVALEPGTARQLRGLLEAPTLDYWTGTAHIVDPDGGANVVFLSGVDRVQPAFTTAELRFAIASWIDAGASPADVALAQATPPRSLGDLLRDDAVGALWRDAYAAARAAWWRLALDTGVDLAFLTDAPLPPGTPGGLGPRSADQPRGLDGPAILRFTTLRGILAPGTVHAGWAQAAWTEADGVVVPWNDFAHGQAVEPTREHGDATLRLTAREIATFRAPPLEASADAQRDDGGAADLPGLPPPPWWDGEAGPAAETLRTA